VVTFRDDLLKKVSRPLAKKVLTSLKGILSEALHRGRVAVNVATTVKIGKSDRHQEDVSIPAIADIRGILAELDERAADAEKLTWRRWRALIATAVLTGMRASEVRGLPWEAVNLKSGKISVIQKADENGSIGKPKSKSSKRTINIPPRLVQILREWKIEAGAGELVFGTGSGKPESLANIFNRAWVPVQLAAGVADKIGRDSDGRPIMKARYNFHALRHFHASMLIADNANPKEVQAELGHSSIKITYDLYGHLFTDEEADKRRSERSERLASQLL
jgi:integrase